MNINRRGFLGIFSGAGFADTESGTILPALGDANGPEAGSRLFFYCAKTGAPRASYARSDLTVANPNPMIADRYGQFGPIHLEDGEYRIILVNRSGERLWASKVKGGVSNYAVIAENGTNSRSLAARAGDRLTPMDFGARGDGRSDDTQAFQAFLDALPGHHGFVPAGVYLCGTLHLPSGANSPFILEGVPSQGGGGAGKGSIIKAARKTEALLSGTAVRSSTISGLVVDADSKARTALRLDSLFRCRLDQLVVRGARDMGIHLIGKPSAKKGHGGTYYTSFSNITARNNGGAGWYIEAYPISSYINSCSWERCSAIFNGRSNRLPVSRNGWHLTAGVNNCNFISCTSEKNRHGHGFYSDAGNNNTFLNGLYEHNGDLNKSDEQIYQIFLAKGAGWTFMNLTTNAKGKSKHIFTPNNRGHVFFGRQSMDRHDFVAPGRDAFYCGGVNGGWVFGSTVGRNEVLGTCQWTRGRPAWAARADGRIQWRDPRHDIADAHIERAGPSLLATGDDDSFQIGDGTWNGGHIRMGRHHLWIDAEGRLRIKRDAPKHDADGQRLGD